MTVYPIDKKEINDNIKIRFNNVLHGFNKYNSFNLEGSEEYIINYILKLFEENNNCCYIDFYSNKLNEESISTLLQMCDSKEYIKEFIYCENSSHFFKINSKEDLIPLIKLSTKEIFFISYYFKEITVWGNYGLKFPCFTLK